MDRIIECVPNFSEGRNKNIINSIADTARGRKDVKVLDVEWDKDHNRSLVTLVGEPEAVFQAAWMMILKATELIDMEKHQGEHPRIGATDVVPFIPVANVTMEECVQLAKRLGKKVARELKIPVYLYEAAATRPERVNLANVRKGEYEGLKKEIATNLDRKPDFGPA
ncbi:glutamate formimidoyltransferase, partial [Patescibacteria group bacterium]|nr:glutamate formimidoyltransferase [Patescibacteria group bacterium]